MDDNTVLQYDISEFIKENTIQDKLVLINPFGYGDTLLVCGFKDALEKHHNVSVHMVIKPQHEIIMKLYGIKDYSIKKFDKKELRIIEKEAEIKNGGLYIAHPYYINDNEELLHKFANNEIDFINLFRETLQLPLHTELQKPIYTPTLTQKLKDKISSIAPLNKIILFSPESFSTERINPKFLEIEAQKLIEKGYTVVSSVLKKNAVIKNTIYIPLNMEEALALAINCAGVCAVRSGLVDILVNYLDKMTVFYPNIETYDIYNLRTFKDKDIRDIIAPGSLLNKIGPCLQIENKGMEQLYRFCITLFRIKRRSNRTKYCVLGIPIWEVKYRAKYKVSCLFGIIPLYKENIE